MQFVGCVYGIRRGGRSKEETAINLWTGNVSAPIKFTVDYQGHNIEGAEGGGQITMMYLSVAVVGWVNGLGKWAVR